MNDDELRAFLESATVGSEPSDGTETAETSPNSQAAPAPEGAALRAETAAPAALTFDEVIGGTRAPATPQAVPAAPATSAPTQSDGAVVPTAPADVEPLVLPHATQPNHVDPNLAPLHLPEPRRPYDTPPAAAQVSPAPANQAPAVPPVDDFPPTEPLSRADLPTAAALSVPSVTAPAPAPVVPPVSLAVPGAAAAAVTAAAVATSAARQPAPQARAADYRPIEVTGGERGLKRWIPWAIVGGGAAIALIASLLIVNTVTAGDEPDSSATGTPTSDTSSPNPSESGTPSTSTPVSPTTPAEDDDEDDDDNDATKPPTVEVGPTMTLPVSQWGITAELSSRFGQTFYNINTPENLVLNSTLIDSLPESCAAMRQQWGILRVDGTKFEVLKPAERCTEAPELYDELWGLTAAMVETITPQ